MILSVTKLKIEREKQGLTQEQVAKEAGVTVNGYQRYEYGERLPRVDTAKLIAKALNSTVEKLF